jgi:class 3 adenylate cyclase
MTFSIKIFLISSLFILCNRANAQLNIDSLLNVWEDTSRHDTSRMHALNKVIWDGFGGYFIDSFEYRHLDSLYNLSKKMYDLAAEKGLKKYQSIGANCISYYFILKRSDSYTILLHQSESIRLAEEIGYLRGLSKCYIDKAEWLFSRRGEKDRFNPLEINDKIEADMKIALEKGRNYAEKSKDQLQIARSKVLLAKTVDVDLVKAANHLTDALKIYDSIENKDRLIQHEYNNINLYLGIVYRRQGYYKKAFDKLSVFLKRVKSIDFKIGGLYELGLLYSKSGYPDIAIEKFNEIKNICESKGNAFCEAIYLTGHGIILLEQKNYVRALDNFKRSHDVFTGTEIPIYPLLLHIGNTYYKQGEYLKAIEHLQKSLNLSEQYHDKLNMHDCYLIIGNVYLEQRDYLTAMSWLKKALSLSILIGDLESQKSIYKSMYEASKVLKNDNDAIAYENKFLLIRDSLSREDLSNKLQELEFSKQILEMQIAHEKDVNKRKNTRNVILGAGIILLLFVTGLWRQLIYVRRSRKVIQDEKSRSENLLLNILPVEIAEELKQNGKVLARNFEMVSIIFTDFKEFTQTSERVSAEELINELNYCFKGFDEIIEKYGVEKIKTIGDSYMAAGGLPVATKDSAKNSILAALEMQSFINKRKKEQDELGQLCFDMRAGIHTGPVVAGIVGVKKYQYDLWGDTVNIASRMESHGEIGKVNISQDTYDLIKHDPIFTFEKREKINVKGKGEMELYFVATP